MVPLSESNLIGADASILSFVRDADVQSFRLVVSGREISGLVSLFDLQRLPVRAALFAMVTSLEIAMTNAIRREEGSARGWIDRLPQKRRADVDVELAKAKTDDAFVDTILFTQFVDKVTILAKSPAFAWPKRPFRSDMSRIRALRDHLAHANDYAATREAAEGVCQTVRMLENWIEQLAGWAT